MADNSRRENRRRSPRLDTVIRGLNTLAIGFRIDHVRPTADLGLWVAVGVLGISGIGCRIEDDYSLRDSPFPPLYDQPILRVLALQTCGTSAMTPPKSIDTKAVPVDRFRIIAEVPQVCSAQFLRIG